MSLRSLRRFNCADVAPRSASGHLLCEAQIIIESWRRHYNKIRPHASLGYKPPAPEVFMPAFAAWPAALRRPAPPATLAQPPTLN
jgi:putative transposase